MTEEQKAVEEMAKVIQTKFACREESAFCINYAQCKGCPHCEEYSNSIAYTLDKAGYRPEAEVRAETARDILGQIQSILGGMIKQDYEDSVQYYQGNCEDIDDRLQNIAEQYGKEEV